MDCYIYDASDGPCENNKEDGRLTVFGGNLPTVSWEPTMSSILCCTPNPENSNIGILRLCQDCGGSYPYMVAELNCGDNCANTQVFGQFCSDEIAPLVGSNLAVCSSMPNSLCVFGGKTYCNGKVQQGYLEGWTAYGEIIDTDESEGFYPGVLSLCCA